MGRGYQPLTTVLCDGCGLVSHHPLPSAQELDAFYASAYRKAYKGGWRPKPKHSLRAQRSAAARTARLAPLLAPGARCLDVGASSGEFVYMMQALGFQASGIEPNDGYRRFGVEAYGIEVASKPLEPGSFGTGVFDLISLNHVFEHLADPLGALHTFRQWLAPGGLVFIEVPNLDGVRKQRMTLFHYAHVWNFSPATLTGLLARAGFVPLPGEDEGSTSLVVAATARPVAADASRNPGHASLLRQQLAQDQSLGAYVASGAPFQRRWARLKRNVDEITTTWRYRDVRAMADAVLAATPIQPGSRRAGVELAFRAPSPGTQTDAACFPGCGTSQAA
jgi:SAM-dependent methyltransferase